MKIVQNPGYRSLLFALLLLLCGCTNISKQTKQPDEFGEAVTIGNRVSLYIPKWLNEQERALLISAATTQLDTFERDWGAGTRPVDVYFLVGEDGCIPCGDLEGRFWGCHYGENGPIHVWLDRHFTAIVLYHELVHHNMSFNDHEHKDTRWETHWEPRQEELIRHLRAKHRRIIGR